MRQPVGKQNSFRKDCALEKDHDIDAYCIAASILKPRTPNISADIYEIRQFRKHNRANIHHQTERTYKLDGKTVQRSAVRGWIRKRRVCRNGMRRWLEKFGTARAETLRSCLTVQKSTRYYNSKDRLLPGTVFRYNKKRYVLTGQLTGGAYYRAYGQEKRNFPARKVQVLQKNAGLVYVM